jgi:hypothetical protein
VSRFDKDWEGVMEKLFSFGFTELSAEDRDMLHRMVRVQRLQILKDTLARVKASELTERLNGRGPEVIQYLGEIVSISKQDTDRFWQILDRWPLPFCLARLLYPDELQDSDHTDHLISNLGAILLFERLLSDVPRDGSAKYVTQVNEDGCIYGLSHGVKARFQEKHFQKRKVEWTCLPREAAVRIVGEDEVEFTVAIPVRDNPHIKLTPLESQTEHFRVLEENAIFGSSINRIVGDYDLTATGGYDPLPLVRSLGQAEGVLSDLWPEALEWAETLIPAFVDLGTPPDNIRLSASYESSSPVFLSRVENHFLHAEDMIHEAQHQRLFLFAGPPHFKSWQDLRQVYVSPYRPDPRHLRGVIVGIHAFLAVNELRRRMIERKQGARNVILQMAELHFENLFAFRTILEHEEFSESCEGLFKQMARTIAQHHSLIRSAITKEFERACDDKICTHIAMVQKQATEANTELRNTSAIYRNWDETARLTANFILEM